MYLEFTFCQDNAAFWTRSVSTLEEWLNGRTYQEPIYEPEI